MQGEKIAGRDGGGEVLKDVVLSCSWQDRKEQEEELPRHKPERCLFQKLRRPA